MRRLVSSDRWTSVLLTAMGLAPLAACGGVSIDPSGDAGTGTGGSGASGTGGSAGTSMVDIDPPVSGSTGAGGDIVHIADAGSAGAPSCRRASGAGGAYGCPRDACDNPMTDEHGIVHCATGFVHRPQRETCVSELPRAIIVSDNSSHCRTDRDCTERPHGFCKIVSTLSGAQCLYGCLNDSECGPAQVCSCGSPVGTCVPAGCATDSECGFSLCASYNANLGCAGGIGYACQSSADECLSDQQCATGMCGLVPLPTPHRACTPRCTQGRPFLVHGEQRTALATDEAGWAARVAPRVEQLTTVERAALADGWARIGLMEHASIAAFARFTMQLMSVGAPLALVEESIAAMRDETAHTQLAFGLASAYAGCPRGPGALDIGGSLAADDLSSIVVMTIHEGCIGETVAAMEAAEAALQARDPAVRQLLTTISADETRHAELAWKFVQWALSRGGAALRDTVRGTFANALAQSTSAPPSLASQLDEVRMAGGILPIALSEQLRHVALHDVVRVCADEMLGRPIAHAA